MIGIRQRLFAAAAGAALAFAAASQAGAAQVDFKPPNYTFPSGFQGFALTAQTTGFTGGVRLGFNPAELVPAVQLPEEGGAAALLPQTKISLANPFEAVMDSPVDGGAFDFLIALLDLGDGSVMPGDDAPRPNADGRTRFDTTLGGHDISIFLAFGGSEVTSWSWGAFNPQPDPPADFATGEIGFAADPFMGFGLTVDGAPARLSLNGVPEPASWALMLVGFAGAGLALRRARRAAVVAGA